MTPAECCDITEIQQKIYRYGWCIDHRSFDELDAHIHGAIRRERERLGEVGVAGEL